MAKNWRFADETLTTTVKMGGRARGRRRDQGMNRTETKYAQQLELRRQIGEILWWSYEGMTFKIGADCRYTPDFCVLLANLDLQCIDTKATEIRYRRGPRKGEVYPAALCEDDSKAKIAVAASLFPLTFILAFEDEQGNWIHQEV